MKAPLIPTQLETPRLLLRTFEDRDWDPFFRLFGDPEAVRYTIKTPLQKWQAWRMLATYVGHWSMRGYGPYAIVEKSSGEMIGPVGLWYPGDWPEPEMSYSIARQFWGKGYVTEAARAIGAMAHRELGWSRLISLMMSENDASKRVAQRLGGVYEKTMPFRDGTADIYAYDLAKF